MAAPAAAAGYAYVGYPLLLKLVGASRQRQAMTNESWNDSTAWPTISITVPAFNEERQIKDTIESLLALDYPADRRQIVIVSDASTDATDRIVREYEDRGVELVRMPRRCGKTAAENAVGPHLRGDIVINTDASIRIRPDAIKPLVAQFVDPSVGVASGRDVSVARANDANVGESGYVGYEMWVRRLENRVFGIVGASGCLYAIRAPLQRTHLPEGLSRDFAASLIAREHGYRAVSVDEAVCFVPRTPSLHREYRRKVRTMARGMRTLMHKRHLMNPTRYGAFAGMLWSHKVGRWAVPWGGVLGLAGLGGFATTDRWARGTLAAVGVGGALATVGWLWPKDRPLPRPLALLTYGAAGNVAALHAAVIGVRRGTNTAMWEPTRREGKEEATVGR